MTASQATGRGQDTGAEPATATAPFRPPPLAMVLLGGSAITSLANSITIPFLAVFLRTGLGLSVSTVGLIAGSAVVFGIAGGFLGGALSDVLGRRRILLASLTVVTASLIGFFFVDSVTTAFLCVGVLALAATAFIPVAKVLLSDMLPAYLRVKWFSYQYLAMNVGYAVGPPIGVALGVAGGRGAFPAAAAVYVLYLAVLWTATRRLPVPQVSGTDLARAGENAGTILRGLRAAARAVAADRRLLLLLVAAVLVETVHSRFSILLGQNFVIEFADSARVLAAVMTTNAVAVIVFQLIAARHVQRFNPVYAITVGGMFSFTGMAGFAFSETMWQYMAAMVVFTVGEVLIVPSEFALLDRIAPADLRGSYFGAQMFSQLGGFTGPYLGSLILAGFGGTAMFLGVGSLGLVGVAIYLQVGRRIPDPERTGTTAGSTTAG